MAASRFPGKPLHPILGRPLLEHCFERARLFEGWDDLVLATCDTDIRDFAEAKGYPVAMTSASHTRALDRVAEAATQIGAGADDLVVCVQGDEPLLAPDMIGAVLGPLRDDEAVDGTMLAVPIRDEETFLNPDIVKIVHDMKGDVLYTSRSPIPYCKTFSAEAGALRVGRHLRFPLAIPPVVHRDPGIPPRDRRGLRFQPHLRQRLSPAHRACSLPALCFGGQPRRHRPRRGRDRGRRAVGALLTC